MKAVTSAGSTQRYSKKSKFKYLSLCKEKGFPNDASQRLKLESFYA